jgi:hypothetical protein
MPILELDHLPSAERHAKCLAAFDFMLNLSLKAVTIKTFTQEEHDRAERVRAQNYYYRDETLYALAFRTDLTNDERALVKSLYDAETQRFTELLPLKESGQILAETVSACAYEMDLVRER